MTSEAEFTVVIPCYNEEGAIAETLEELSQELMGERPFHIVVVDDGSKDRSPAILAELEARIPQLRVVTHKRNRGYGAALKTGFRQAKSEFVVITDADGTYPNHRIPQLVAMARDRQLDMLVGARVGSDVQYSKLRAIPKIFLKAWVSFLVGESVPDMNSGLRVFRRAVTLPYLKLLPNSFSFTTTVTIAFLCAEQTVHYEPIAYKARIGQSKIKPIRDTLRFCQLILRTGMYFAPIRALTPVIALLGMGFLVSASYDVFIIGDLTDKTVILAMFTLNAVLFALLADMLVKRFNA